MAFTHPIYRVQRMIGRVGARSRADEVVVDHS